MIRHHALDPATAGHRAALPLAGGADGRDDPAVAFLAQLELHLLALLESRKVHAPGSEEVHGHGWPAQGLDGLVGQLDHAVIRHHALDPATAGDRPRGPALAIGGLGLGHAHHAGLDAGLGVDEELAGNHDLFTFLQAVDDLHPVTRLDARLHDAGCKPAFPQGHDDPALAVHADEGLAWNHQDPGLEAAVDAHIGIHVGLERLVRIVETEAYGERAGTGIQVGIDVLHLAFPHPAGQEGQAHLGRVPHVGPVHLLLEDLGQQPDRGQVGELHHLRGRLHVHPRPHLERGHDAVLGRAEFDGLHHLPRPPQPLDLVLGHAQRDEALARGGKQDLVAAAHALQVLLLGVDQRGGIESVEKLALPHPLALGLHQQAFDPAIGARVHVHQP